MDQVTGSGDRIEELLTSFGGFFIDRFESPVDISAVAILHIGEGVILVGFDPVNDDRQLRHDIGVEHHAGRIPGDAGSQIVGIHQLIHSAVTVSHRHDAEGDRGGNPQDKGLTAEHDLALHIGVSILVIVDLEDQLIVIPVDIAFVTAA